MIATLLIAAGTAFPYPSVTPAEFQSGAFDGKRIKMVATVVDGFVDELDPRYVFFVLRNSGEDAYASMMRKFFDKPIFHNTHRPRRRRERHLKRGRGDPGPRGTS